jgi:uncharacterized membrane protein
MLYPPFAPAPASLRRGSPWQRAALAFVFLWFLADGCAHVLSTGFEASAWPPSLPAPRALVLASGALELLGAVGLLFERTRRGAGWGLALLTVAATPASVHMLQAHDRFALPEWLLWARLPFQLVLLWLLVWGSRWRRPRPLYR